MWPSWYAYPGLYIAGPGISFGLGFHVGFFAGLGWGWRNWGLDWGHRAVIFNHNTYISHSPTFIHRGGSERGSPQFNHGASRGFDRAPAPHGFAAPHAAPGLHSGAFGGFDHGGFVHNYSFRGHSSFGGGFHGGGFHGGGGHR